MQVRIKRRSSVFLALVMGAALASLPAGAASAADTPLAVAFTTPSQTLEYGQHWSFQLTADSIFNWVYQTDGSTITSTGTPSGFAPVLAVYLTGSGNAEGYLQAPYEKPPLGAGTYTFTVKGAYDDGSTNYTWQTTPSASLTIEKAKLGIELRVLADPSNSDNAIVSARFTGRFVDEYSSSFYLGAAISPAGSWRITIKDSEGATALEKTIDRTAGDDVLATTFYWTDAEPGEQYTATAEFTPTGDSASNFAVTPASTFKYTASSSVRPLPASTAPATPGEDLPEPAGFGLPLWLLIVVIVLILGLGALVTVLGIRLSHRPAVAAAEVSA